MTYQIHDLEDEISRESRYQVKLVNEDEAMQRTNDVHRRVVRTPVCPGTLTSSELSAENEDELRRFAELMYHHLHSGQCCHAVRE